MRRHPDTRPRGRTAQAAQRGGARRQEHPRESCQRGEPPAHPRSMTAAAPASAVLARSHDRLLDHAGPAAIGPDQLLHQRDHESDHADDHQDHPAVWMSMPATVAVTANLSIAPTAIRKMDVPMYMAGWYPPGSRPQTPTGRMY